MHPRMQQYLLGSQFAGLEAELMSDRIVYRLMVIQRTKKKVRIVKSLPETSELAVVVNALPGNIPVVLCITGKGVLCKNVQADQDAERTTLLRKILPNVTAADFVLDSVYHSRGEHIVAIARHETIDAVVNEVKSHLAVVSVRIGAVCVHSIVSLFGDQSKIEAGTHVIAVQDRQLFAVTYQQLAGEQRELQLGTDKISSHQLIALAAAFQLIGRVESEELQEYSARKLSRLLTRSAVVFFLTVLFLNFLAFSYYRNKAAGLNARPEVTGNLNAQVNALHAEIAERKTFLTRTGLLNTISYAWYADQVAHSMPAGIQLTRLNFSPRLQLNADDSIGFDMNHLEIAGNCTQSIVLNQWLQLLKKKNWIQRAVIESFEQSHTDARGAFTLELEL